ncbi:MAG TPA: hypothetical protein VLL08_02060 [Kineosporiaceae bacterium]|nr:hypothetical protein [Kineosporiaceae bacterium]
MNLTDLTAELETRATDAVPTVAMNRLTGVRQRIRARRRKQVASAAGLTALGVAAVILIPGMSQLRADRVPTPPAIDAPIQPANPLTFAADVAGDPLIARGVSAPGAGELVVRFTPTDTRLAVSFFCRTPGVTESLKDGSPFQYEATINGHRYNTRNYCSGDVGANESTFSYGDIDSTENRQRWAKLGVKPGQESVLRMTVKATKGKAVAPPTTRLGAGIYALTGERVMAAGVPIKVQAEIDGHQYRLAGHTAAPATAKRHRLSLNVPAGPHPAAVLFGNPGDTSEYDPGGAASLAVDGKQRSSNGGGITASGELLDDAGAHTLELRLDPKLRGTMVLAYYVRVD